MVFGKRDTRTDLPGEDIVGNLYGDTPSEVDLTPSAPEFRRDLGNESWIDPHSRFNGKYTSDRDLRIEGEAAGEIECQGTLILSPQARVRASVKAHSAVINGDYEGKMECNGRFEVGSTGRVKGQITTQVLVIKEGAFFEGSVVMSRETAGAASASKPANSSTAAPSPLEVFPKETAAATAGSSSERQATGPGDDGK